MPGRETAQPPRTPKARATTGISDAPFELFEELAHVPARVIQPETAYPIFARRSDKKYHDQLPLLIRLFFAIAILAPPESAGASARSLSLLRPVVVQ